MLETLIIKADDIYIQKIISILENFPKNQIEIRHKKIYKKDSAFGILNGKIEDPMKWQRDIREESDSDIYTPMKL